MGEIIDTVNLVNMCEKFDLYPIYIDEGRVALCKDATQDGVSGLSVQIIELRPPTADELEIFKTRLRQRDEEGGY